MKGKTEVLKISQNKKEISGPVRESNPGPLAPKARIMPLDQQAALTNTLDNLGNYTSGIRKDLKG